MKNKLILRRTQNTLTILTTIFVATLITANAVSGKIINTGLSLLGNPITVPGAIMCYPITFLITDIIGELWGKKEANTVVKYGFIGQAVSTLVIFIAKYTPCVDAETQGAYNTILGQNWIFVVGGMTAYLISQNLDVKIFHSIRERYISKHGSTKGGRWIWNNLSTMTSQLVDTAVFIIISFGIGLGWLWNNPIMLLNMTIGQYAVKLIIALLDTPFFYFFTRKADK